MERETGLEPATFSLARRRSTTELFPHVHVPLGSLGVMVRTFKEV